MEGEKKTGLELKKKTEKGPGKYTKHAGNTDVEQTQPGTQRDVFSVHSSLSDSRPRAQFCSTKQPEMKTTGPHRNGSFAWHYLEQETVKQKSIKVYAVIITEFFSGVLFA